MEYGSDSTLKGRGLGRAATVMGLDETDDSQLIAISDDDGLFRAALTVSVWARLMNLI